jgi:hypothetical protein
MSSDNAFDGGSTVTTQKYVCETRERYLFEQNNFRSALPWLSIVRIAVC